MQLGRGGGPRAAFGHHHEPSELVDLHIDAWYASIQSPAFIGRMSARGATVTIVDLLVVAAAGLAAGVINAVAGAGALLTFPVFLALGMSPFPATRRNPIR